MSPGCIVLQKRRFFFFTLEPQQNNLILLLLLVFILFFWIKVSLLQRGDSVSSAPYYLSLSKTLGCYI